MLCGEVASSTFRFLPNIKGIANYTSPVIADCAAVGSTIATSASLAAESSGASTALPVALNNSATSFDFGRGLLIVL